MPIQDETIREFLRQYWRLKRRDCSDVEWIMHKMSCTREQAQRWIAQADPANRIREEEASKWAGYPLTWGDEG